VPAPRTEVTEVVTGLALFGFDDVRDGLAARPKEFRHVPHATWDRLADLERGGRMRPEFHAAWANGLAFLRADEGLRGRTPLVVEWKGGHRAPGDDVVPADLRVDHVYLVSCKYLSRILINASPAHLFDRGLRGGHGVVSGDWYLEVDPDGYQDLYAAVRSTLPGGLGLPPFAADVTGEHRGVLRDRLRGPWPAGTAAAYRAFAARVAQRSAERWRSALATKRDREAMLWRLLRIGSAPYFILGASADRSLRLRIATPWDWRQAFDLRRFDVWGDEAGQPLVRWRAVVAARETGEELDVAGHVEVRWSHGRFAQPPEAKVRLDTPHHRVPGYFPLA
jgi:hypothetical protein